MRALLPLAMTALFAPAAAHAACDAPYALESVLADLVAVETALRDGQDSSASEAAGRLQAGIGCLDEVLQVQIVGRTYRAIGAGLYAGGDADRGRQWMRTAYEADPTFAYGIQDMRAGHPVALAYEDVRKEMMPEPLPQGDALGEGTHYMDGRRIFGPLATADRPHLYQLKLDGVESWVIEGNAFPDAAYGPAEVADAGKAPKEKKEKPSRTKARPEEPAATNASGVAIIERERPPGKTPLMIAGGAVVVGSGALYYYSSVTRGKFADATVREDIERYRALTNRLVLASGAILAVGTGTFAWGVALDGGGTVLPAMTVRF